MPTVNLSNEVMKKVQAFEKVVKAVMRPSDQPKVQEDLIELVIEIGLDKMLHDVLPKEDTLLGTMTSMFNENPEFVSAFVANTISRGEETQKKEAEEARRRWARFV